jgi:hypothetical protein
MFPRNGDKN